MHTSAQSPRPTKVQLAWQDMEFYLFTHFGPNTFTDKEWGAGDEPEDVFNPVGFDPLQWCRIAKQAGAKGIIITAKHHDGFCLWPSKFSNHTVKESKWKNGKGDVLRELSQACRETGLKFGVYISPWDRNHPKYGTAAYNDVFVGMLEEIFSNYGPIWELWWDGANGEGPDGKKQVYDWHRFKETVYRLSPQTLVFSDVGPHIRWVGNERGIAGETNWNTMDTAGYTPGIGAPPTDTLNRGNINGKAWIPAECDVSIRPGWFYHPEEDQKVKTPAQLFNLYLKSVGRGANLLLNVPPDRNGLIARYDSASLVGFGKLVSGSFKNNLSKNARGELHYKGIVYQTDHLIDANEKTMESLPDFREGSFWIKFNPVQKINCIVLKESLEEGQQIKKLSISFVNGAEDMGQINLTTVGHKRIITFPQKTVSGIRIVIQDAKEMPSLSEVETYLIDEKLIEQ
ncbi:MAG: glycoside hydrolase family 29 (alpha-L-fucosidase) [Terrimonas sp.]|nr:glycoside hydrolase family 29 (alpha-L-fucosidase) [Terrimonas sp.]